MRPTPSFLGIPREIRDRIYDYLVRMLIPAPEYDPEEDPSTREELSDVEYVGGGGGRRVRWQTRTSAVPHPAARVMGLCRQVRAEAIEAWERLTSTGRLPCVVDVVLLAGAEQQRELRPTLLSVFDPYPRFDSVTAHVRIVGLPPRRRRRGSEPTMAGGPESVTTPHAGPGGWGRRRGRTVYWMFYDLLCRFLKAGPVLGGEGKVDRHVVVQRLDIDMLPLEDGRPLAPADTMETRSVAPQNAGGHSPPLGPDSGPGLGLTQMRPDWTPDWLCDWLATHIGRLLTMHFRVAEYGAIFFERIGSIRILCGGVLKQEFDLGSMFFETPRSLGNGGEGPFGDLWRDYREQWFNEWKEDTLAARRESGLPLRPEEET